MRSQTEQHWSNLNILPIFTLLATDHGVELPVLDGNDEDSLLFAPCRSYNSFYPSDHGTVVIYGNHHFDFLKDINLHDKITINDQIGSQFNYYVEHVGIIDLNQTDINVIEADTLKLVTPWPFKKQIEDKSIRFVVTARKDERL